MPVLIEGPTIVINGNEDLAWLKVCGGKCSLNADARYKSNSLQKVNLFIYKPLRRHSVSDGVWRYHAMVWSRLKPVYLGREFHPAC